VPPTEPGRVPEGSKNGAARGFDLKNAPTRQKYSLIAHRTSPESTGVSDQLTLGGLPISRSKWNDGFGADSGPS
jgi:hypothetical protein